MSSFQSFNPGYTTRLELTARQPLWRNFLGRELELQQELASAGEIAPAYRLRLQLQGVQAETEQLAWALAALEEQLVVMRDLIALSQRFATLMENRRNLGRAEDLDVAAADAGLVAREGALLQLELARDDLRRRLAVRTGRPVEALPSLTLRADAPPLPVSDVAAARPTRRRTATTWPCSRPAGRRSGPSRILPASRAAPRSRSSARWPRAVSKARSAARCPMPSMTATT